MRIRQSPSGKLLPPVVSEIRDEGAPVLPAQSAIDFVGAGVTVTVVGDSYRVTIPGGGGGGGPGGANKEIQFNDGGSFGGDPKLTWDKATGSFLANGLGLGGSFSATGFLTMGLNGTGPNAIFGAGGWQLYTINGDGSVGSGFNVAGFGNGNISGTGPGGGSLVFQSWAGVSYSGNGPGSGGSYSVTYDTFDVSIYGPPTIRIDATTEATKANGRLLAWDAVGSRNVYVDPPVAPSGARSDLKTFTLAACASTTLTFSGGGALHDCYVGIAGIIQAATLQSVACFVVQIGNPGNVQLGLYSVAAFGAGAVLLASSAPFAPVNGLNVVPLTVPLPVTPGRYFLAMTAPQSTQVIWTGTLATTPADGIEFCGRNQNLPGAAPTLPANLSGFTRGATPGANTLIWLGAA